MKGASSAIAMLVLLAFAGCSSSSAPAAPEPIPQNSELANTELHLMLDQCKQVESGLYKCPAFEKDLCGPEYSGQAECVRIGKKGSIFVKSSAAK